MADTPSQREASDYVVTALYGTLMLLAGSRLVFAHGIPCWEAWGRKRLVLALVLLMSALRCTEKVDGFVEGSSNMGTIVQVCADRIAVCVWFTLLGYVLLQWINIARAKYSKQATCLKRTFLLCNLVFYCLVLAVTIVFETGTVVPALVMDLPRAVIGTMALMLTVGVTYVAVLVAQHVKHLPGAVQARYTLALRVFMVVMASVAVVFLAQLLTYIVVLAVALRQDKGMGIILTSSCGDYTVLCNVLARWLPELLPATLILMVVWTPDAVRPRHRTPPPSALHALAPSADALSTHVHRVSSASSTSSASSVGGGGGGVGGGVPLSEHSFLEASFTDVKAAVVSYTTSQRRGGGLDNPLLGRSGLAPAEAEYARLQEHLASHEQGREYHGPLHVLVGPGGEEEEGGGGGSGSTASSGGADTGPGRLPHTVRLETEGGTRADMGAGSPTRRLVWTRTDTSSFSTHRLMTDDAPAVLQLCLALGMRHVDLPLTHRTVLSVVETARLPTASELLSGGAIFDAPLARPGGGAPVSRRGHGAGDSVPFRKLGDVSAGDLCRFVKLARSEAVLADVDTPLDDQNGGGYPVMLGPEEVEPRGGSGGGGRSADEGGSPPPRRTSSGAISAASLGTRQASGTTTVSEPGGEAPPPAPPSGGGIAHSTSLDGGALDGGGSQGPPSRRLRRKVSSSTRRTSGVALTHPGQAAFALLMRVEAPLLEVGGRGRVSSITGMSAAPAPDMRCGLDTAGIVHVAGMAFRNTVVRAHVYAAADGPEAAEVVPTAALPVPPLASVVTRSTPMVGVGPCPAASGPTPPPAAQAASLDTGRSQALAAAAAATSGEAGSGPTPSSTSLQGGGSGPTAARSVSTASPSSAPPTSGPTPRPARVIWLGAVETDLATVLASHTAHVHLALRNAQGRQLGVVALRLAAMKRGLAERLPAGHPRSLLQRGLPVPSDAVRYVDVQAAHQATAPTAQRTASGMQGGGSTGAGPAPLLRLPSGRGAQMDTGGVGGGTPPPPGPAPPLPGLDGAGGTGVETPLPPSDGAVAAGGGPTSPPPLPPPSKKPKKEVDTWPPYASRMTRWYNMTNRDGNALLVEEDLREAAYTFDVPAKYLQLAVFQKTRMLANLQAQLSREGPGELGATMPQRRPASAAARARVVLEGGSVLGWGGVRGPRPPPRRTVTTRPSRSSSSEMRKLNSTGRSDSGSSSAPGGGVFQALAVTAEGRGLGGELEDATWFGAWGGILDDLERAIRDNTDRSERVKHLDAMIAELNGWLGRLRAGAALGYHGRGPGGESFKRSTRKADQALAFLPLNLHVQEMRVRSVGPAVGLPCSLAGDTTAGVVDHDHPTWSADPDEHWYYALTPASVAEHAAVLGHRASAPPPAGSTVGRVAVEHAVREWAPFGNWAHAPQGGPTPRAGDPPPIPPTASSSYSVDGDFEGQALPRSRLDSHGAPIGMGGPTSELVALSPPAAAEEEGGAEEGGAAPRPVTLPDRGGTPPPPPLSPSRQRRARRRIGSILAASMAAASMSRAAAGRDVESRAATLTPEEVAARAAALSLGAGSPLPEGEEEDTATPPSTSDEGGAAHPREEEDEEEEGVSPPPPTYLNEPSVGIEGRAHGAQAGGGNATEVIYDTITVGAFAAHALGFKAGGMRSYVAQALELRHKIETARQRLAGLRRVAKPESHLSLNHLKRQLAQLYLQLEMRSDVIMSQALTAAVTAFARKVRLIQRYMSLEDGRKLLEQYLRIGFLLAVQSLLSTLGSEIGMLEDFERAVSMLSTVQFRLMPPLPPGMVRGAGDAAPDAVPGDASPREGSSTDGRHVWMTEWRSGDGGAVRLVRYKAEDAAGSGGGGRMRTLVELRMWPMSSPAECAEAVAAVSRREGGPPLQPGSGMGSPLLGPLRDTRPPPSASTEDVMTAEDVAAGWTDPRLVRLVPKALRQGFRVVVTPVILTQGINEMQTLASMLPFSSQVRLQTDINEVQYQQLTTYYTRYKVFYQQETEQVRQRLVQAIAALPPALQERYALQVQHPPPRSGPVAVRRAEFDDTTDEEGDGELPAHSGAADTPWAAVLSPAPGGLDRASLIARLRDVRRLRGEYRRRIEKTRALDTCMTHTGTLTSQARSKQTLPVYMSNLVVRMMHGGYIMSCKSAKDRTSMGVTYQQAIMLSVYHGVDNFATLAIADLMRRHGVRRLNAEKNIGVRKYAFSSFQAPFLPVELQPPPGTGGGGVTS